MICANCGQTFTEGKFCPDCGGRLTDAAQPAPPPEQEQSIADWESSLPASPAAEQPANVYEEPPAPVFDEQATVVYEEQPVQTYRPYDEPATAYAELQEDRVGGSGAQYVKGGIGAGRIILCSALALFLSITAFLAAAAFIISPGNLVKYAAKADISRVVYETGVADEAAAQIKTLALYESFAFGNSSFYKAFNYVEAEDIIDFLNIPAVKREVGALAGKYIYAAAEGDWKYHITVNDLITSMKAVAPEAEDHFGYAFKSSDYNYLKEYLNETIDTRKIGADKLLKGTGVNTSLLSALLSKLPLIVALILCGVLIYDVLYLLRHRLRHAPLFIGIAAMLGGLFTVAVWGILDPFSGAVHAEWWEYAVELAPGLAAAALFYGAILMACGVFFIAARCLIRVLMGAHVHDERAVNNSGLMAALGLAGKIAAAVINVGGAGACAVLIMTAVLAA